MLRAVNQRGDDLSGNQALVASDGGGEEHIVCCTHTNEVVGVHHDGILGHTFPHAHVASLLPIEVGQRGLRSGSVGMHNVAIVGVATEDVGDDFAECVRVEPLVEILDGVVDVFFFCGDAALTITIVHYLNFNFLSFVSNSKLPSCFMSFCPMTHCSTIFFTTLHSTL